MIRTISHSACSRSRIAIRCIPLVVSLLVTASGRAQGFVQHDTLFSELLNSERVIDVYLPNGYDSPDSSEVRFPLYIFLHGADTSPGTYSQFAVNVFNPMMDGGLIHAAILAFPDGRTPPYAGSFYTNSDLYGPFEDHIVDEVVAFLDSTYRTLASPDSRCILGHSMGGFGAMQIAIDHPDRFRAVASHSGILDFGDLSLQFSAMLEENGGTGPFQPTAGIFSTLGYSMAGAFSPHPGLEPEPVDFMLADDGTIIDSVFARWMPHNPSDLVERLTPDELPIYFDCGTGDELFLLPRSQAFADSLTLLGIPFTFGTFPGGHANALIGRIPYSMVFLDSAMFGREQRLEAAPAPLPIQPALLSVWPNPFNSVTSVKVSLVSGGRFDLHIFDLLGREVARLHPESYTRESAIIPWDAGSLSSGHYFVFLNSEQGNRVVQVRLVR